MLYLLAYIYLKYIAHYHIMKATWNNQVIAQSDDTIIVENNHYFPKESVKAEYLKTQLPIQPARGRDWHLIIL
jgi:uncharacterized protein (DUF427 family)